MKETVVYSSSDNSVAIREYTDKYGYKTQDTVTFGGNTYTQSYTTDYMGNILSVKDFKANAEGLSNTASYTYDVTNKVLTETTSAGTITNTYNNTTGLLTSTKDRRGTTTTYTYDNMGRLTRESSGSTDTRYYYDINGNAAQTRYYTDSSNYNVTKNVYDSRNRLTDVITKPDENEIVTRYVYDGSGRLLKVAEGLTSVANTIDPDQHRVTEYAYDAYGNMSKQTDPMGDFTEYRYNLLGMLVSQTDKNGTDTNYAYDVRGNLLQKAYTTAEGETDSVTYTYDMAGNLTKMVDSLGTTEYNYDSIGNLLSEVAGNTTKAYTYDANGNPTSYALTVDGVSKQNHVYTYDGLNRVASITDGSKVTTYTYDANGNVLNETSKEGTTTRKTTVYTYNALNLPLTKRVTTGTGYENYTMTYDMLGNTKTVTSNVSGTSKSTNYNYDGIGRLLSETYSDGTGINYTYDKYNNMTGKTSQNATVSYVYDKNNRLVSSTQTGADVTNNFNYYYDNNGNLITKTQSILKVSADAPSTSLGTTSPYLSTYQYDGWNRLTGATIGDTVASYAYKGDNLRQSKTVTDQNGTKTTNFTYGGMNIVYDDDGTVTNNYVRGITGLIYRTDAEGTTDYFRTNQHGDVTAVASNTGTTKQAYEYDAYGNQSEDATIANPFQYCGEYQDLCSGLIYLRNRYYDPSIGRFITEDPAMDGLNWYIYCGNNPVNYVDPLGLAPSEMEAALISEHIYNWDKNSAKDKRIVSGWRLIDTLYGREDMKMGIYIREGEDWQNPTEYVVAFKGTTWYELNEWKNNAEQLLSPKSADMWDAINYACGFVNGKSQEITFVGHSKGGAEAASAAVATNKNAMIFNPATSNLSDYGLSASTYTADMTAFIVKGDIVNYLEGWFSVPIDKVVELPQRYGGHWYEGWQTNTVQRILNHLMPSVKNALMEKGYR